MIMLYTPHDATHTASAEDAREPPRTYLDQTHDGRQAEIIESSPRWHQDRLFNGSWTWRICESNIKCYDIALSSHAESVTGNNAVTGSVPDNVATLRAIVYDRLGHYVPDGTYYQQIYKVTGSPDEDTRMINYVRISQEPHVFDIVVDTSTMSLRKSPGYHTNPYIKSLERTLFLIGGGIRIGDGTLLSYAPLLQLGARWTAPPENIYVVDMSRTYSYQDVMHRGTIYDISYATHVKIARVLLSPYLPLPVSFTTMADDADLYHNHHVPARFWYRLIDTNAIEIETAGPDSMISRGYNFTATDRPANHSNIYTGGGNTNDVQYEPDIIIASPGHAAYDIDSTGPAGTPHAGAGNAGTADTGTANTAGGSNIATPDNPAPGTSPASLLDIAGDLVSDSVYSLLAGLAGQLPPDMLADIAAAISDRTGDTDIDAAPDAAPETGIAAAPVPANSANTHIAHASANTAITISTDSSWYAYGDAITFYGTASAGISGAGAGHAGAGHNNTGYAGANIDADTVTITIRDHSGKKISTHGSIPVHDGTYAFSIPDSWKIPYVGMASATARHAALEAHVGFEIVPPMSGIGISGRHADSVQLSPPEIYIAVGPGDAGYHNIAIPVHTAAYTAMTNHDAGADMSAHDPAHDPIHDPIHDHAHAAIPAPDAWSIHVGGLPASHRVVAVPSGHADTAPAPPGTPAVPAAGSEYVISAYLPADRHGISIYMDGRQVPECVGESHCISSVLDYVIDGDTVRLDDGAGTRVRLALVSAPETYEPGGIRAKNLVSDACPPGTEILVDGDDGQKYGSYGRVVGAVYCNGVNLNQLLLESGMGELAERFCETSEFATTSWAVRHGC